MDPTRRNLLASSGVFLALGGASPLLAEQATPTSKRKTPGRTKTDTTRDPFAQLAYQRAKQDPSIDHTDIRDYGTVVGGGDITAALQAALDAIGTTTLNSRIRIPMVGNGSYTCGDITFPGASIILEFDCMQVVTSATWNIPGAYTLRGLRIRAIGHPHPYQPTPRAHIIGTANPVIELTSTNHLIENLEIVGTNGVGLYLHGSEITTCRNLLVRTSHSTLPAFHAESVFWVQILNCSFEPGLQAGPSAGGPSMLFSTLENWGKNTGIVLMRDIICLRNGMKFVAQYGPSGIDNFDIERYHVEGLQDNGSVIEFDASVGPGKIGGFFIRDVESSDPVGTVNTAFIRNTGGGTDGIVLQQFNKPMHITGDPILNFVLDYTKHDVGDSNMAPSFNSAFSGTAAAHAHQYRTSGALDAKLLTSPVGLPWTVYTPFNVIQDPTLWTPVDGPETVTPVLGPDGSMMGGRVVSNGGAGVVCFGSIFNVFTINQGDVFLCGVWGRHPSQGSFLATAITGLEMFGAGGSNISLDAGYGGHLCGELMDRIGDNGWRWFCTAVRVTNIPNNLCAIRFRLGAGREWFNPCAMHIPAADVALIDEIHLRNLERSLKGGWSSTNVRGDTGVLDHQTFKAGVFKATAKTFATLPSSPVAGMQAYITDCNTATWGATAAGGGSSKVMVWYNGSNWTVMGK